MAPWPALARAGAARCAATLAVLALSLQGALAGQEVRSQQTAAVFRRFADRVVKVEVVERSSAARASLGSGFLVTASGHVITNYHVIAEVVHAPERYRAELVRAEGPPVPVVILGIDVVHDLAVLHARELERGPYFVLGLPDVAQGDRLYSLGHPQDLGLSIVEGTYNGLLRHTLYPRIHFTGSINPGMSGGPTMDGEGRVVGVNVATAGNQMSFLVPVARAADLVRSVTAPGHRASRPLLEDVGAQLTANQDRYLEDLFAPGGKSFRLGPFRVAREPASFFRCWGDVDPERELPYGTAYYRCSTNDYVFLAGDQSTGIVELEHTLLTSRSLNAWRFHSLYSSQFGTDETPAGVEEHVTRWKCVTRNVRSGELPLRAVLCVRRYRKFAGLYDAVLRTAALGRAHSGLISTLTLSGVSYPNVTRITDRFLRQISWQ